MFTELKEDTDEQLTKISKISKIMHEKNKNTNRDRNQEKKKKEPVQKFQK